MSNLCLLFHQWIHLPFVTLLPKDHSTCRMFICFYRIRKRTILDWLITCLMSNQKCKKINNQRKCPNQAYYFISRLSMNRNSARLMTKSYETTTWSLYVVLDSLFLSPLGRTHLNNNNASESFFKMKLSRCSIVSSLINIFQW